MTLSQEQVKGEKKKGQTQLTFLPGSPPGSGLDDKFSISSNVLRGRDV